MYYVKTTQATAKFCKYFVNVRHLYGGEIARKDFLAPYESPDDPRFNWLENDFLQYLKEWKDVAETRHENVSSKERENMLISRQTHEGVIMTVKSLIETTRIVLGAGMDFFLPEKVNQDYTEEQLCTNLAQMLNPEIFMRSSTLFLICKNQKIRQFG